MMTVHCATALAAGVCVDRRLQIYRGQCCHECYFMQYSYAANCGIVSWRLSAINLVVPLGHRPYFNTVPCEHVI
jgi:hypothetical protein